jgi:hypothetical protein
VTNEIVSYEFTEHAVPGLYSWDMEYTAALPFEKKDTSGFVFDITLLDNLPATKDRFNTFIVTNTSEWNRALDLVKRGGSGTAAKPNDHTLTVSGNVAVTGGADNTFGGVANIALTLNGNGKLYLSSQGSLLNIGGDQTVCIDSADLTLQGLKSGQNNLTLDNYRTIITVNSTGKLELKNGKISDNKTTVNGSGVNVLNGGTFTMTGGSISDNTTTANGGGVYVDKSTFTLNGGTISGNTAINGGGVVATSSSTFAMNEGTISGNTASGNNGGVGVYQNSTFTMAGGTLSANTASSHSGGVGIYDNGIFTMNGGIISHNTANDYYAGGVYVNSGKFDMNEGTISGNTAKYGGGVHITTNCTFNMTNGTISGNTATINGGGVDTNGTFTMISGTISGNRAYEYGGGEYVVLGAIIKTGGTITGYSSDTVNGNKVQNSSNTILSNRGHAVNVESIRYQSGTVFGIPQYSYRRNWRDTTAGPNNYLDASNNGASGGWVN